jgi:hypothetical protein
MAFRDGTDAHPHGWPGGPYDLNGYAQARCFVLGTGVSLMERVAPAAGGAIDGVSCPAPTTGAGYMACHGMPVKVEASAAFALGVDLETLADDRVKQVATGKAVLRALQASAGAGSIVWAVFKSGV